MEKRNKNKIKSNLRTKIALYVNTTVEWLSCNYVMAGLLPQSPN